MKCPECKKKLNLKLNKCSNCGYPLDKIKEIEKEDIVLNQKQETEPVIKKIEKKHKNNNRKDYLISGIFSAVLLACLGLLKSMNSLYSGTLSFFQMFKWTICRAFGITYMTSNLVVLVIVGFIILGFVLSSLRKKTATVLACIGYFLFTLALAAYGFIMYMLDRIPNIYYYITCFLILGWIIYLIIRKDKPKEINKGTSYLDEIKEAKNMLEEGIITEEEFKLLKNKIINKE